MTPFRSYDPTTGALVSEHPLHDTAEVEGRLAAVAAAAARSRRTPIAERADWLRALAATLRAHRNSHALLMAEEMGKPLTQGLGEVDKCAWACEYAAEHAAAWLQPELVATEARSSSVHRVPMGAILAIMPWNFPFWQVFRFAASAIAAGNTVLLKHAPNVPRLSAVIDGLCAAAGVPADLVREVRVDPVAIPALIGDPRVAALTFTGSTAVGRVVAASAGQALKPSVLELGGSDPFIVLADADLDRAADVGARGRLQNNGQSCIASKRFIVERAVAGPFIDRLAAQFETWSCADPRDPAARLGPMARPDLRETLHRQVERSVAAGARVVVGGTMTEGPGWFYPATLLVDSAPGQAAWDEECFGPAAALCVVDDADEAFRLAAATSFGLGATVFSADAFGAAERGLDLPAGAIFVNDLLRSDPRLPFGGTRESGWGRELGRDGMWAFTHTVTRWVA